MCRIMDFRAKYHHILIYLFLHVLAYHLSTATSDYVIVPNNKVDVGFSHLDKNGDGLIFPDEFSRLINTDDKNGDGCVSKSEYEDGAEAAHALSDMMFGYFDSNKTGCLTTQIMALEFTKADKDGSGHVSVKEWESYFHQLMKQLFSPQSPVHAVG